MCTLAWQATGQSAWVVFNRDEQLSRATGEPPQLREGPDGRVLAYPTDPVGGGSWIAVSSAGFCVALLNHYTASAPTPQSGERSRGQLVLEIAAAANEKGASELLREIDFSPFAPFHLFIISHSGGKGVSWPGGAMKTPFGLKGFWTTSSYCLEAVRARRSVRYSAASVESLEAASTLLREVEEKAPAYGLAMQRDDACTVSQTEVELFPPEVKGESAFSMRYRARESVEGLCGWETKVKEVRYGLA
jgi:hypothetical protein